jgi:hypothetical protein
MAKAPASNPQERKNPLDVLNIGLEAVKGGPAAMLVWAGGSIVALTVIVAPSFFAARRADLAFWTVLFAIVIVSLLAWLAVKHPARFLLQYRWRVVQQPMRNEKVVEALVKELSNIHGVARDAFEAAMPDVGAQVRTNIFLADYRRAPDGVGCELRMPAPFRHRMLDASEWDIAFQPGQGATGEVFLVGQPVMTTKRLYGLDSEKTIFDPVLSPKLKAIISLPIFDDEHPNVVAVLNIDVCGDADVKEEHLPQVYDKLRGSPNFQNVRNLINKLDKAWLTIGLSAA